LSLSRWLSWCLCCCFDGAEENLNLSAAKKNRSTDLELDPLIHQGTLDQDTGRVELDRHPHGMGSLHTGSSSQGHPSPHPGTVSLQRMGSNLADQPQRDPQATVPPPTAGQADTRRIFAPTASESLKKATTAAPTATNASDNHSNMRGFLIPRQLFSQPFLGLLCIFAG